MLKSARDPFQRLRLGDTGLIVAVDPTTQRLLKYAELDEHGAATAQSVKIDAALFSERDDVQVVMTKMTGYTVYKAVLSASALGSSVNFSTTHHHYACM